jgi:hypothetical protein
MTEIIQIITDAAQAAGISANLLVALCFSESSFREIVRPKDGRHTSYGICQVQLPAAHDVDEDIRAIDLMNPEINAYVAATYLKMKIKEFNGRTWCGVDAYNKGSGNVDCPEFDNNYSSKYTNLVKKNLKTKPWIRVKKPRKVINNVIN